MSSIAPPPPPWRASVLTLTPKIFPGPLAYGLAGKALSAYRWSLACVNPRDFADPPRAALDDPPYGGGGGMVLRADILVRALAAAVDENDARPRLYLSPRGVPLTQRRVVELAAGQGAILLCGRYEGVDQRCLDHGGFEEISVGDFILSGGEIAALALLDAVIRLLPGTAGNPQSLHRESFADDLLEHPHYTRPRFVAGRGVPEVLLSGDHRAVAAWRRARAEELTKRRRPDLWLRRARPPSLSS